MVREATSIDISTMPDLARLADEVARTRRPRVLHRNNKAVAVLMPARRTPRRGKKGKTLTQAQREAVLSTFGAWKGHIDAEQLKREIKEARSDHRPPVNL